MSEQMPARGLVGKFNGWLYGLFESEMFSAKDMVRMNIWAEAMRSFSDADSNADMSLVLKVLNSNATIPVKVLGRDGDVQMLRNMEDEAATVSSNGMSGAGC